MSWKIPDDTLQDIRDRVSIVEVVSSYVTLKRSGRNFTGLCPFHNEKTPSFTVSDDRGLFYCFGCSTGGTVFNFVMRMERLEFPEAVEMLARRAGIALPERGPRGGPSGDDRERIARINEWAAKRFTAILNGDQGAQACRYLESRGVTAELAKAYGLGFAPAAGSYLTRALHGRQAALAAAVQAGLVLRRDGGGYYDRFRGRLMFPIADKRGRVVGFGGRSLDDTHPKYLNSSESPVFRKGDLLYGLPQAREAIRRSDQVVVVEGYMDALALVQHGIGDVVATLGTALTPSHLRTLRRFARRIIVFFDGDTAGRTAATRAFEVCAQSGTWVDAAFLPEGDDPDSFVRRRGAEAVTELLARAVPVADFYFDQLRAATGTSIGERARAAEDTARVLSEVKNAVERDLLLRKAAERLGIGEDVLRGALARKPVPRAQTAAAAERSPAPAAEQLLVEIMAVDREAARFALHRGAVAKFRDTDLGACAERIAEAWLEGPRAVTEAIGQMPAEIAARLSAAVIGAADDAPTHAMKSAEECVARIEREAQRRVAESTLQELRRAESAGDEERERELLRQAQEQLRRRDGAGV